MPTRNFITGAGGSIMVGATTLCVVEWSIKLDAPTVDTTNTCDLIAGIAYNSFINAPISVTGSVKSYFDSANNPFTTPLVTLGATVTLVLNVGLSGKSWTIPARISTINQVNNVKNVVTYDLEWQFNPAQGTIGYPS